MSEQRRAEVIWDGDLMSGHGTVSAKTSGVFSKIPLGWKARIETVPTRTNPEELLAAAHASCFAMALAHGLAQDKHKPQKLEVSATVSFGKTDAGFRIEKSVLEVTGRVGGIDDAAFQKAAEAAKNNCPMSQALKGNVEMSVTAKLAGGAQ